MTTNIMLKTNHFPQVQSLCRFYGRYTSMNLRDDQQLKKHNLFDSRFPGSLRLPPTAQPPRRAKDASLIKIPPKVERGPTDILKALASTIGTDHTAPHYKYHDDPYLIPVSNLAKRSFSLSKEAGRKAARWIRQEHAILFQHKVASPPIEAFYPTVVINEQTEVSEALLLHLITQGHLTEAKTVYEMLKNKNAELNRSTKQSLLELLAYYNENESVDDEWIEERWYRSGVVARERQKNTWKEHGLAETLFRELEPQDASAYCAMIRGRAKHFQAEKAWNLYTEAQSKSLLIDVETINSMIRVVHFARESSELRWQLVEELLFDIANMGLQPNLSTLNSVLEAISTLGNIRQARTLALQTLAEFKNLGIQPSLGSYYFILIIHCKERGPINSILVDIMEEIKGKSFTIEHPKDTFFFTSAMDNCRNHLQNLDLAHKVDNLLHTGNNYDLLGDSYKESVYYRHFLALRCNMEAFDVFMEYYNKIVPNIYTPEPGIVEEVLRSLELNGSIQHIPRIWSDMIIFNHSLRENLVTLLLQIMANEFPEDEKSEFRKSFVEIGKAIWTLFEAQDPERGRKSLWTGKMLGDLITIFVKGKAYTEAGEVLKKLLQGSQDVLGVPDINALKIFLDVVIVEENSAMCLAIMQYTSDCGFAEIVEMAEKIHANVKLDSLQISRLSNIVGFDITTNSKSNSFTAFTKESSS